MKAKVEHIEELLAAIPKKLAELHKIHTMFKQVLSFLTNPPFKPTKVSPDDLAKTYEGSASLTTLVLESVGHSFLEVLGLSEKEYYKTQLYPYHATISIEFYAAYNSLKNLLTWLPDL